MREQFPHAPLPWIDLSTGINPWPYKASNLDPALLARLPLCEDDDACRSAMAAAWGVARSALLVAPGSELLIRLLPFVVSARRVAILSPTYGDHAHAWRRAGAEIVETDDPLRHANRVDAVVVCNPNNPDGRTFTASELHAAHKTLRHRGGWLIIDEAYADLDPGLSLAASGGDDGLIILRSFGKFFGLPGLRLGAFMAPPAVRCAMAEMLGVWPVSGAALQIGTSAYRDLAWHETTRGRLAQARASLDAQLTAAGLSVIGGTSLFAYVRVSDATLVWECLAQGGIYARRFQGSETRLRIGLPRGRDAEARLAAALTLLS